MRRLDRYLIGETLLPFGIGAAAAVMLLTGGLLAEFGPLLLDRKVGMLAVMQLLLFRLPFLLVIAAPVATAVGTAMAVSRLARDQEVLVMRMAGVSVRRIFLPYIVMGLAMFGLTYWFQEAVVPGSGSAFKQLFFRISLMQSQPSLAPNTVLRVREFIFCLGFVQQRSDRVFEVQEVTAFRPKGVKEVTITRAPRAVYDNGRWILDDPQTWVFGDGGRLLHFEKTERMVIEGRVPLQDIVGAPQPDELTREKLGQLIEQERQAGRDVRAKEVQYHTKLAVPFACVIFSIFGPIFSLAFARSGGFAGVLLSVLVVFAHINLLLLFSKILGEPGVIPPIVAAWAPNAIFFFAALIAMRRVE